MSITLEQLTAHMNGFLRESPLNRVEEINLGTIYDLPLIGLAKANDPLFTDLQNPEVVGPRHLLPSDWLPGAKSVLSFFLPFSQEVRYANRELGLPAIEWVYGRIEGEECNRALRQFLVELLQANGAKAVAPALDERYSVKEKRSNWSERHIAYISGLGTFGLHKSLITKQGCAGRYGSVVTDLELPPTARGYTGIYDYCSMCLECIPRCPSGAIKPEGKQVMVCSNYVDSEVKPRFAPRYGCGKCQTTVPCEHELPV